MDVIWNSSCMFNSHFTLELDASSDELDPAYFHTELDL